MTASTARKDGLPPVVRSDARLLVLGSLPGERSLKAARYYAHPRNGFWQLMSLVVDADITAIGYEKRLAVLLSKRIALWDVIGSAQRSGSLDQALRDVEARDLASFVAALPELRAVAFNGATAARLGRRALAGSALDLVDLPSSSPAYTLALGAKAGRWAMLRHYLD